jgi:hypothetical protein
MLTPLSPSLPAPSPVGPVQLVAYCVLERPDETPVWVRCGSARLLRDGSVNVRLDALPLTGRLHLRPASEPAPAIRSARPPTLLTPEPSRALDS